MVQIKNGSEVFIADGNDCVRKLMRPSNQVSVFVGRCGNRHNVVKYRAPASEAEFLELKAVLANEEKQEFYYLSEDREGQGILTRHDLGTGN